MESSHKWAIFGRIVVEYGILCVSPLASLAISTMVDTHVGMFLRSA